MEEFRMVSKRVFIFAVLFAICATSAYAGGLGYNVATLDLGPVALPTSTLDQSNASGIIKTTPGYDGVRQYLSYAFDGGAWDQTGITSQNATATGWNGTGTLLYGIGVASGADYKAISGATDFYGVDLTPAATDTWTLTKFTYTGDADLNGIITADDQYYLGVTIDALNAGESPVISWTSGDFDYNGIVTADDQFYQGLVIDYANTNWGGVTPPLSSGGLAPISSTQSVIPEPSTMLLLVMAFAGFVGYRKIRN